MTTLLLFKILESDGSPPYHRDNLDVYSLPEGKQPGTWTPYIGNPKVHQRGYHLTKEPGLYWKGKNRLFVAATRGAIDIAGDRVAASSVRLVEEVTPEWKLLPLCPDIRALLIWQWRANVGPDAEPPAWAHLRRLNVSRIRLDRVDLTGIGAQRLNAQGTHFNRAILNRTLFVGANFSRAELTNVTQAHETDFTRADFSGADLSGSDLSQATLDEAIVSPETIFLGTKLTKKQCDGLDLTPAQRREVRIVPGHFSPAMRFEFG